MKKQTQEQKAGAVGMAMEIYIKYKSSAADYL